jgi:hypothetical protein
MPKRIETGAAFHGHAEDYLAVTAKQSTGKSS